MENNTLIALMGLVILLIVLVPSYINKQNENTITVLGEYQDFYYPDVAEVVLTIETFSKEVKEAASSNKEISNNVIDALINSGIKKNDIESISFDLQKKEECGQYTEPIETKEVFTGYRCKQIGYTQIHRLKVTAYDIENVGKYIDAGVNAGANNIDSLNFKLSESKEAELRSKALELASKNARTKAEAVTKGLKSRIKSVKSVSEVSYSYGPPYYAEAMLKLADTRIQPKSENINARVNVVFTLS